MCKLATFVLPIILTFVVFVSEVSCIVCTKEELFGDTRPLICPQPNDAKDKVYCCGPKKLRYCCSYADYASAISAKNEEHLLTAPCCPKVDSVSLKNFLEKTNTIGIIVGVLVTAIVVVVIIVVVSCFCCSCCLLAKRRNRGNRYTGQPATTATTTTMQYPAQQAYPIQTFNTGYPQQQYQQQYPQQQFSQEQFQHQYPPNPYPPQAPYPPAGGYQGGFPPQGNPPPYPINDQPPYNPSFPPGK